MGENLADDLTGGDLAVAHGSQQVFVTGKAEFGRNSLEIAALLDLLEVDGIFAKVLLTDFPPQNDTSLALLGLDPGADLVASPGTPYNLEPVLAGGMVRRGDDLDNVTVLQLVLE